MKMSELKKDELADVTSWYYEFDVPYTLETFVENMIRRCECCGNIELVDYADDLPSVLNWDGKYYKCCSDCKPLMEESYKAMKNVDSEYDFYDRCCDYE